MMVTLAAINRVLKVFGVCLVVETGDAGEPTVLHLWRVSTWRRMARIGATVGGGAVSLPRREMSRMAPGA